MASRSYAKMVAQYHREYPHQVAVINGNEWRDKALSNQHYAVTQGPLMQWFEDGKKVYGFASAEQAAAFKAWVDTCGIDWSTDPREGPIPEFAKPAERPSLYGPTKESRRGR
jgi:hypothetical protein